MKQKNIITISAAVVAVVAVLGLSAYTFAAGNRGSWGNKEAFKEAVEAGNYEAWSELVGGKGKIGEIINNENFSQFSQMHNLMQEGKVEEAKAIAEELGLPGKAGFKGMHQGKGMKDINFTEIQVAIEAGDYEAWSNLKTGSRMAEFITEENFDKLVQMHNLMQEGKVEEAQVIREGLGIPGKGKGMGMGGGRSCGACPMNK